MLNTEFVEAFKGRTELEITVKGRRSKEEHKVTVWFVHEGNKIYLLPVSGSDTSWYKNVLKDPNVTLTVSRSSLRTKANHITNPEDVQKIIKLFAGKYGGMSEIKRWYSKLDVAVETSIA